ncbi:hypothetical protein Tco_0246047 [Tanacetum coccineum]
MSLVNPLLLPLSHVLLAARDYLVITSSDIIPLWNFVLAHYLDGLRCWALTFEKVKHASSNMVISSYNPKHRYYFRVFLYILSLEESKSSSMDCRHDNFPQVTSSRDSSSFVKYRTSTCQIPIHILQDNLRLGMIYHQRSAGEKKTVKKHSQTSRGVLVGLKMGFKPHKEYRHVLKKPTASSSGNKKKGVDLIIEVSNSNPFDVLNSVDNDGEFGTNASNTPIGEKINKIERQIGEGKLRLLDNDRNPLVPIGNVESDSEVEAVFNEIANLRISTCGKDGSDKGYGTNSLLE